MKQPGIAIYTKEDGTLCPFEDATECRVFQKNTQWSVLRVLAITPGRECSMEQIRREITALIAQLGDCAVMAGQCMRGLPYQMFDAAGYAIFEISEIQSVILEQILADITASAPPVSAPIGPEETETAGIYRLDLRRLQQEPPGLSSKQILSGFFTGTPFVQLHLICDHLPPWIAKAGFRVETQRNSNGVLEAVVYGKSCN